MNSISNKRIIFLLGLSLCLSTSHAQIEPSLFAYEKIEQPLFTIDSSYTSGNVVIKRGTYDTADPFRVSAFIIAPPEIKDNSPLIIFNHWGEGNKTEFLEEAISFSAKGFICMLPDEPWLCPQSTITSFMRHGDMMVRQAVINTRVAIDLMEDNYSIDTNHIYVVGHSYGCASATILSAIESRIDYFIFMTGVYSTTESASNTTRQDFIDWRTRFPEEFNKWISRLQPYDPDLYLGFKKAPCLVQVARHDEFITKEENEKFIKLTPDPKKVKWYDATHALNDEARKDRMEWVLKMCDR